ncbi:unnamed protein product [Paramecium sonneborni]|uniref:Transmembrane protein n=1 Tax=Paramecium sonneborni TaxID=65129 RepID=A0A8S1PFM8_9CILI|nr:unnamed protein product [Paramecium sonneborni]
MELDLFIKFSSVQTLFLLLFLFLLQQQYILQLIDYPKRHSTYPIYRRYVNLLIQFLTYFYLFLKRKKKVYLSVNKNTVQYKYYKFSFINNNKFYINYAKLYATIKQIVILQGILRELIIHKRRLSDIQQRKISIPKLDKTVDIYKQNRFITARKQEINKWEGIKIQNQKLLKKINNVESSFQKSVNIQQNILVFKIIHSQQNLLNIRRIDKKKIIEYNLNYRKCNNFGNFYSSTSTFKKPKKQCQRISQSSQKLEKSHQLNNSYQKSFNVQPIMNYRFQGKGFTKHKIFHQSGEEKQKIMSIIQKYQQVLDQFLPNTQFNK